MISGGAAPIWSFCAAAAVIGADGLAGPHTPPIRANDGSSTRLRHSGTTAFEAMRVMRHDRPAHER
jgi:hypothetical protein